METKIRKSTRVDDRGLTLVELIVSLAIVCGGVAALMGVFKSSARGITLNRTMTEVTALAQERIESVKSISYYRLRVTSSTVVVAGLAPPVLSDPSQYGEPEISIGSKKFHRYTTVSKIRKQADSSVLEPVPWTDPDTGLKRVEVTVVWKEGTEMKQVVLSSLYENPHRPVSKSNFFGHVTSTTSIPLANAKIEIIENPALHSVTDPSGFYELGAHPATYSLRASASGYFTVSRWNVLLTGSASDQSFQLSKKSSVTVTGTVWMNDHPVVSQVVGAMNVGISFPSGDEYVEVYNPTTWTWTTFSGSGRMGLKFQRRNALDPIPRDIDIDYRNTTLPPRCFYLFANKDTVEMASGYTRNADAVWFATSPHNQTEFATARNANAKFTSSDPNVIPVYEDWVVASAREGEGSLILYTIDDALGEIIQDKVGWTGGGSGTSPAIFEGVPLSQMQGIERNEQFCRYTSTVAVVDGLRAPAMDSNNNDRDWDSFNPISLSRYPKNSSPGDSVLPVAGTPAVGAEIFVNDGMSSPVTATLEIPPMDRPSLAKFSVGSVATGAWTVSGFLADSFGSNSVNTAVSSVTRIFLSTSTSRGFVSGRVTSNNGADLSGIRVKCDWASTNSNTQGIYFLEVDPGIWPVTANPGAENPAYVQAKRNVMVDKGKLTSGIDFVLFGGQLLRGKMTVDGVNPLPDFPVKITEFISGLAHSEVPSMGDGFFDVTVPTGTYIVEPIPESLETVVPPSVVVGSSTGGDTVWTATFTVSSAYGSIVGRVLSASGEAITSGVMIFVSETALAGSPPSPPVITEAFRVSGAKCFMATTGGDGTFEVRVKGGSPVINYHVYGYYVLAASASPALEVRQVSVSVPAGARVMCPDLVW
jgi:prepilin-type N-terminal cleavage/methylation domain-containing protein